MVSVDRRTLLTGDPPALRPFVIAPHVREADETLLAELGWEIGDHTALGPLHLIPLHVGVLVLRQWADAVVTECPTRIYQEAVHARTRAARDLAKGQGKPTTPRETAAARASCDWAIGLLRAFDHVPVPTKARLSRCQNPRCPDNQPFFVGLAKRLDYCSPTCRARLAEARTAKARKQKKEPALGTSSSL